MSLEKLFESLDEKVFTPELKDSLKAQFNEAVETKAAEIAEEKIEEATAEIEVKSAEHIEFLNEKAEEYVEIKKTEMLESLDKYMDRIVEEFVEETKAKLDESVKAEKAEMIIEAFESMLVSTGVKLADITEARDESSIETELKEAVEKNDSLVEENISLKEENDKLIKMGAIAELKEGLSIVEGEKFEKLAALVEFTNDESFTEKLETIKESVKGSKEEEVDLNEGEEETDESKKPVWDHLV